VTARGQHHQECQHLEVTGTGELALHRVRATRREQAGDGALSALPTTEATAEASSFWA
jgi:hypothetical protein